MSVGVDVDQRKGIVFKLLFTFVHRALHLTLKLNVLFSLSPAIVMYTIARQRTERDSRGLA